MVRGVHVVIGVLRPLGIAHQIVQHDGKLRPAHHSMRLHRAVFAEHALGGPALKGRGARVRREGRKHQRRHQDSQAQEN